MRGKPREAVMEARRISRDPVLRAALLKFVDHFGPLEDNHMLHSEARACFNLAREALGPEQHDAAIKRAAGIAR